MDDKQRAVKVKEIEPGVWEYSDGSVRKGNGHLVRPAPENAITPENVQAFQRLRREKTRQRIIEAIEEEARAFLEKHPDGLVNGNSGVDGFAIAAGLLFRDIVLNSEAPPRDRLQAFVRLGQVAGAISTSQDGEGGHSGGPVQLTGDALKVIRDILTDRPQVIDGRVRSVGSDGSV